MTKTYLSYNSIVSAYGFDSSSAIANIGKEVTSLRTFEDKSLLPHRFCASRINNDALDAAFTKLAPKEPYTRLEKMFILALEKTISRSGLALNERVGLILSTTKGNIDVLEPESPFMANRAYLSEMGSKIKTFFGFQNDAIVLSNACVSGILAVAVAKRFIQQHRYDHVFVVGGDLVTKFILSGFNAFQALSDEPCRPYCKTRSGINLGEVGASVLVTIDDSKLDEASVEILGESSCNDANHISGPSRTGEGLFRCVISALEQSGLSPSEINFISAHGTATPFNDEMEAIAFSRARLQDVPLNSLKGYFGHTLGASGLLETIIGMHSLHQNTLFASKGFRDLGVSKPLNIIKETRSAPLRSFLKTASGFGGCNTAVVFQEIISKT